MKHAYKIHYLIIAFSIILGLTSACGPIPTPADTTTTNSPLPPTPLRTASPTSAPEKQYETPGLTDDQAKTLYSLEKVDDYPLYTMRYFGSYGHSYTPDKQERTVRRDLNDAPVFPSYHWACSLFAALGDPTEMLLGRNFDWEFSPAVLLFTDPPDGYASVSIVDITYLDFRGSKAANLTDLPISQRRALLYAPHIPFDGMNETGLAIGMAAVTPGGMQPDPEKETLDSLGVIREILDRAGDVNEAITILGEYNIDFSGGPPLHYLVADASGNAALVEFYQGELFVIPNQAPWHLATNFLINATGGAAEGQCERYDRINQRLTIKNGKMTVEEAMDLLLQVSQDSTQWSVVYGISDKEISVMMGRAYQSVHRFDLQYPGHVLSPIPLPEAIPISAAGLQRHECVQAGDEEAQGYHQYHPDQ